MGKFRFLLPVVLVLTMADKDVARLIVVVVFPTPPFWLAMEIILVMFFFGFYVFYF